MGLIVIGNGTRVRTTSGGAVYSGRDMVHTKIKQRPLMLPIFTNQIVFRSCFFLRHEPTSGRRHPQPGTKKFPCLPDDKRERERKCPGTTATLELASFALP